MSDVRVLWLTKGLGRGGAEMLLVSLALAMDRQRIALEVGYRLPQKTALVERMREVGVPTHSLGEGHAPWPFVLRRLLTSGQYDVVHSHAPLVGAAARMVAPRGTVLLHTEHNTWERYHPATRLVNAATLGRNDKVWAVSEEVATSIRRPRPLGLPDIEVMLHGVDPATVRRGPLACRAARARLGLDEEAVVLGTVGNLAVKKDQITMIRAFADVHRRLPASCLILVGTGPQEAHLRSLTQRLGLGSDVRFLGMRDDVPELLPAFDVFVLSSIHEGLSIASIEALAAGLPVVATRVGGIPELIEDGEHGVLVPPRDVDALSHALLRLVLDDAERARLSAAGPVRAARFGIQPAADILVEHYHRLGARRQQQQGSLR